MKKVTNNDKINRALNLIMTASSLLQDAASERTWAEGKAVILYYMDELNEIISCDNGEAGLEVLVKAWEKKS